MSKSSLSLECFTPSTRIFHRYVHQSCVICRSVVHCWTLHRPPRSGTVSIVGPPPKPRSGVVSPPRWGQDIPNQTSMGCHERNVQSFRTVEVECVGSTFRVDWLRPDRQRRW
jgi:hypothetical protein